MVTPDETASASPAASEQFPGLAAGLNELIDDASGRAKSMRFYVKFWQVIDVVLGLLAATLAAVAGAADLASTPAACRPRSWRCARRAWPWPISFSAAASVSRRTARAGTRGRSWNGMLAWREVS